LARVEDCCGWLNEDMLDASMQYHESMQVKNIGTYTTAKNGSTVPGPGTILYFAVPADAAASTEVLQADEETALESNKNEQIPSNFSFAFRPLPAYTSVDGTFRILVADDVLMIRKGMLHLIGKVWGSCFPDCPVSIYTACTAEDMLRAARSQPFDLIICDHLFNPIESEVRQISPQELVEEDRVFGTVQKRQKKHCGER